MSRANVITGFRADGDGKVCLELWILVDFSDETSWYSERLLRQLLLISMRDLSNIFFYSSILLRVFLLFLSFPSVLLILFLVHSTIEESSPYRKEMIVKRLRYFKTEEL